jgi:hypothetical protein
MKRIAMLLLVAVLSPLVFAQTSQRDALIDRVEATYFQATLYAPDSPSIDLLCQSVSAANPGISSEKWSVLKKDISLAVANSMSERGGPLDTAIRNSLKNLSEAELETLGQILGNPVYAKFQGAIGTRSTQEQFLVAAMGAMAKMTGAVNTVLARYGLKPVH